MALGDRMARAQQQRAALQVEQNNVRFREAAQRAADNNPGINRAIFNDIANGLVRAGNDFRSDTAGMGAPNQHGMPVDQRYMQMRAGHIQRQHQEALHQQIVSRYGQEGELAWRAYGKELQGPGLLSSFAKLFYDSDKGGLQIGGIVGALAGGAMAYFLTGGGAAGGWLGIAALIISPIAGAVLGNRAMNAINSASNSGPVFPGQGQIPTQARGSSVSQTASVSPGSVDVSTAQVDTNITGGTHVADNNIGGLPSQTPGGNTPNQPGIGTTTRGFTFG